MTIVDQISNDFYDIKSYRVELEKIYKPTIEDYLRPFAVTNDTDRLELFYNKYKEIKKEYEEINNFIIENKDYILALPSDKQKKIAEWIEDKNLEDLKKLKASVEKKKFEEKQNSNELKELVGFFQKEENKEYLSYDETKQLTEAIEQKDIEKLKELKASVEPKILQILLKELEENKKHLTDDETKQLTEAIEKKDIEKLKELKASVESKSNGNQDEEEYKKIVKFVSENISYIEHLSEEEKTQLTEAIETKNIEELKKLKASVEPKILQILLKELEENKKHLTDDETKQLTEAIEAKNIENLKKLKASVEKKKFEEKQNSQDLKELEGFFQKEENKKYLSEEEKTQLTEAIEKKDIKKLKELKASVEEQILQILLKELEGFFQKEENKKYLSEEEKTQLGEALKQKDIEKLKKLKASTEEKIKEELKKELQANEIKDIIFEDNVYDAVLFFEKSIEDFFESLKNKREKLAIEMPTIKEGENKIAKLKEHRDLQISKYINSWYSVCYKYETYFGLYRDLSDMREVVATSKSKKDKEDMYYEELFTNKSFAVCDAFCDARFESYVFALNSFAKYSSQFNERRIIVCLRKIERCKDKKSKDKKSYFLFLRFITIKLTSMYLLKPAKIKELLEKISEYGKEQNESRYTNIKSRIGKI